MRSGQGADGIGFTLLRFLHRHLGRRSLDSPLARGPARQAADGLALGSGHPETGLVLVDAPGAPIRPEAYSDRFAVLCREAGLGKIDRHLLRHTLAGIHAPGRSGPG